MRNTLIVLAMLAVLGLAGFFSLQSAYNDLVVQQEGVRRQLSQVQVVYQRRADLIPNLVATAKGYAEFEQKTLTGIAEARARVGGIQLPPDATADPARLGEYQAAQAQLSAQVRQFMVVVENYPTLKANENFRALMDELSGTENRISVERKRFNDAAGDYNASVRKFPRNIIASLFGFGQIPYFEAAAGADKAPEVKF